MSSFWEGFEKRATDKTELGSDHGYNKLLIPALGLGAALIGRKAYKNRFSPKIKTTAQTLGHVPPPTKRTSGMINTEKMKRDFSYVGGKAEEATKSTSKKTQKPSKASLGDAFGTMFMNML